MRDGTFTEDSKVAIVGVGYWGSKLLRNLVAVVGLEQVIVVDSNIDALRRAYESYPGIETTQSLDDALLDPKVAGVLVATQASTHRDVAVQALNAGCHILVEKPLASSAKEASEIVDLAEEVGRVVLVGHTFLFSPRVDLLARLVREENAVGAMHYIASSRLNLGLFRPDANVIWDLGPHDLSIIIHLLGESPIRVQTAARDLLDDRRPDVAFVNMWFPSGMVASMNLSWMAPRKERRAVVVGHKGMIRFDDADADEPIKIFDKGVDRIDSADYGSNQLTYRHGNTVAPYVDAQEPLHRQLQTFVHAMRTGNVPISDGAFGVEVVRALEAADRSWQLDGQPVVVGGD